MVVLDAGLEDFLQWLYPCADSLPGSHDPLGHLEIQQEVPSPCNFAAQTVSQLPQVSASIAPA